MVVLPSRMTQSFNVMEAGARVDGDNRAIHGSLFVPAAATTCPDCAVQEFLSVLVIVIVCAVADGETLDAFGLDLVDAFPDVNPHHLDALDQRSVG